MASAIVLPARRFTSPHQSIEIDWPGGSNGVPGLIYAWRLSQAVIMTTQFSHEIDASRLRLSAKVRFGNPMGNDLNVSYPIIKYFLNHKLLFTSSEQGQNLI